MGGAAGLFAIVVLVYLVLGNKLKSKETRYVASLVEGTKSNNFSMDVFYQKFYIKCVKIPFLRRYILKLRRRLEILNIDDSFIINSEQLKLAYYLKKTTLCPLISAIEVMLPPALKISNNR